MAVLHSIVVETYVLIQVGSVTVTQCLQSGKLLYFVVFWREGEYYMTNI